MEISLPKIFELIGEIEEKYNVDKIISGNVRLWNLIRVILYFFVQSNLNKPSMAKIFNILMESVFPPKIYKGGIWAFSGAESRKYRNGAYYDIYMDPLYDVFEDRLCVFEWPAPDGFRNKGKIFSKNYVKMHIPLFSKTFFALSFKKTSNNSIFGYDILDRILEEYSKKTGFEKEILKKGIYEAILYFVELKKYFTKILKKYSPEAVLIRCGYGRFHMALSQACRELDIPSIELQHGIITRYHAGYVKASSSDNRDGVPEYLLTYGDAFSDIVKKGSLFEKNKVVSVGFPYMEEVKESPPMVNDEIKNFVNGFSKTIFVTSQWTVGDEIKEFVMDLAKKIGDSVGIIFKPHPRDWRKYDDLKGYRNIFVASKYDDTYEIFKIIDVHSTAYSTSGLESLAFGKPNIFIDIGKTSIEDIIHVVDNDSSFMASSPDDYIEIFELLLENYENAVNKAKKVAEKFFKSNAKENIRNFMEGLNIC